MRADAESLPPPRRPWLRRLAWTALAGAAAIVMAIVAARRAPDWYVERLAIRDAGIVDRDARRLVTTAAGLQAAAARPGDWGAAVREAEVNAWLATDLPRNHATALPGWMSEPRVRLEPGRIRVAARAAVGPLAGTLVVDFDVRLRGVNHMECAVAGARLGVIPLPAGPFVHRTAALLGRLGLATDLRRLDGRSVVVVSLGGRGATLRGLSVGDGELVLAGTTEERR